MARKKKHEEETEPLYMINKRMMEENGWKWSTYDRDDDYDDIPVGCRACGGDYPHCKYSCPLFD